ncbi:MAG: PAS domain-containing protein [Hyphomonas sp.]|nr:PAS domain-containing protein [Hyphomonas sp.]
MPDRTIHPNTRVLLDAWRRMNAHPDAADGDAPRVHDHPELVERLFVIQHMKDGAWMFRNAGETLTGLLGRQLTNHNFLHLWTGPDRHMMNAFLEAIRLDSAPGVVRGRGETLTGQRVELEVTLMPLARHMDAQDPYRLLGLYQTLGGEPMLKGRPVWRHRVSMLVPPDTRKPEPRLKLVASNA